MTGNQIKGKGFRGALRYNLEKVEKGVAEILDHSFASTSERIITKEIQMVKVLRPNLQKYFYHTSINFPPGEDLPNEKMKQIGSTILSQMALLSTNSSCSDIMMLIILTFTSWLTGSAMMDRC